MNINVGNRVEITVIREEKSKTFISVVEDIYDEKSILIHIPIVYGALVKLPLTLKYKMLFYTEKGMFEYEAKIVKYVTEGSFNFMLIELCSEPRKFQRREFFRYECIVPFKFDKLLEDENELNFNPDPDIILTDGIIKDISAGGLRFLADEELEKDEKIKCFVQLTENDVIISAARVIHKQLFPQSQYKYQYRVEFLMMKESDRDKIIKFIFEEQRRKQKKKSLT